MRNKPDCPRCRTNVNVVKYGYRYRCAFCGELIKGDEGQQELSPFIQ